MNLMAFEAEKQQAALIPLALLRLGVLESFPPVVRRVWLISGLASRALIGYQLRARGGL